VSPVSVTVAKKQPPQRNETSVKIDSDVYRLVRTVAAWRGVNVSEYLSEIVAPIARRDVQRMQKDLGRETDEVE